MKFLHAADVHLDSPLRGLLRYDGAPVDEIRAATRKSTGRYDSPYEPDEEDGSVSVLVGKWYEGEKIAEWLKLHAEAGGRLIQHSCQADGEAWGWEFDGEGRLLELALAPVGEWK